MADLKISQLTGATTPLAGTEVVPVVQSSTTKKVAVSDLTAGRDVNAKSIALTGVAATGYLSMTAGGTTTNYNLGQITNTGGGLYWGVDNNAGTAFGGNTAYGSVVATSTATDLSLGVNNAVKWRISNVTGDLVQVVAGDGVNFTANTPAAGMTSQLLNWYEEGTWTPTLVTDGTGFTSVTYSSETGGRYVRVGKIVHFQMTVRTSAVTIGSASGNVLIDGLPFTAATSSGSTQNGNSVAVGGVSVSWVTNNPVFGVIQNNSTKILLYVSQAATTATVANVGTGSNENYLQLSGSYVCA